MPATILHVLANLIHTSTLWGNFTVILINQMKKLRFREVK